jgi:DMSO/TMAO reductase YedYZ molybdopterin-dependent catalytic subunit
VVAAPSVIQCAGNGRGFFAPVIPGLGWGRGAVGHCEWSGVRLADVLNRAGVGAGAAHVHFLGTDGPPSPKTPLYLRSLPIAKALDPTVLLATVMNGEPLPVLHGGPVRLVVPGWTANHWMKWVRWITVSDVEAPGFYQQTGYKMPIRPMPPEATPAPADLRPVTVMNVKSLITGPAEGAQLPAGPVEVRGVAWTGDGHVTRVDVAAGADDAWTPAEFLDAPRPGAWRRWRLRMEAPTRGALTLRSRATDSTGAVQPDATPWNRSGYLWNGIDAVRVTIG